MTLDQVGISALVISIMLGFWTEKHFTFTVSHHHAPWIIDGYQSIMKAAAISLSRGNTNTPGHLTLQTLVGS